MNAPDPENVLWDVALQALLNEQFQARGEALDLVALQAMSDQHSIRLDDILDTLCKLTRHGEWCYLGRDGEAADPDGDMCRLLQANHRLNALQLDRLRGRWQPVAGV